MGQEEKLKNCLKVIKTVTTTTAKTAFEYDSLGRLYRIKKSFTIKTGQNIAPAAYLRQAISLTLEKQQLPANAQLTYYE